MRTKKKPVRSTASSSWILNEKTAPPVVALGAMIGVVILTLLFHTVVRPQSDTPTAKKSSSTTVTITTSDAIDLAANLEYPSGSGPWPVVILVHEFGQDRNQWSAYRDFFIGEGFAVLRYDIRGFGASTLAAIPSGQNGWFVSMPTDLAAVVNYASAQKKIDDQKIFVIGVGLGANIAYVGAGTLPAIDKTVLLSPTINSQLDGSGIDNFFPKHILGVANTADQTALQALMDRATDVDSQSIMLEGTARGLSALEDETFRTRVVDWLKL